METENLETERRKAKYENMERRKADDLSMSSESHLVDGATGKEGKPRKKSNTPHGNGKPGNRKKENEIWKYGTTQGRRPIDEF